MIASDCANWSLGWGPKITLHANLISHLFLLTICLRSNLGANKNCQKLVINCLPISFVSSFRVVVFGRFPCLSPECFFNEFRRCFLFSSQLAHCKLMSPKWQANQFSRGEENRKKREKQANLSDRPARQFVNCQHLSVLISFANV